MNAAATPTVDNERNRPGRGTPGVRLVRYDPAPAGALKRRARILLHAATMVPWCAIHAVRYFFASKVRGVQPDEALGRALRDFLLSQGPLYVKMGQILATRSDLIPERTAKILQTLQDDVPPMSVKATVRTLREALGREPREVFRSIDLNPIASASIAQVHRGILLDGAEVAVKLVRRGVEERLRTNLGLLGIFARIVHLAVPPARGLNAPARVAELSDLLMQQVDMRLEAANLSDMSANFQGHAYVSVPRLVEDVVERGVLAMEFVHGIPGKDHHLVQKSPKLLAQRLQESVYTMLYMDGVCHGDPHPGNVFFTPSGGLVFVDFGITVRLTETEKWGLSSFNYACIRREWDIAIDRFQEHFVCRKEGIRGREAEFREAFRGILVHHFEEVGDNWDTGAFFKDVNAALKRFGAEYVTNFTKVELALTSCEGFAKQLDPRIDVWANARSFCDRYSPFPSDEVRRTFDEHFGRTIPKSIAMRERARSSLIAPTHLDRFFLPSTYPLFVEHAEGARITDLDGNTFVDLSCGYGPNILGYNHPVVRETLAKALGTGNVSALGHQAEVLFAEDLAGAFPGADRVVFSNSGTEALIHAVRICKAHRKGARKIAKFEGHYHGFSDQGMVSSWFRFDGPVERPLPMAGTLGSHPGLVRDTVVLQYGSERSLEALDENPDDIACVLVEPLPASLARWDRDFLQALRDRCDKHGIPLVFDEVVTGFRVAWGGAQNLAEVEPDLTCLGKIIGGSLPCGAVVGKSRVMEVARTSGDPFVDYERKTFVGGTMSGNLYSMLAGRAVVGHLRENPGIYSHLERTTDQLCATLSAIATEAGVPFRIRGCRSIFTMSFSHRDKRFYRERFSGSNFKANLALAYYMRKNGVYMPELHAMLIGAEHGAPEIEIVAGAFRRSLEEMTSAGFFVP